MDVRDYNQERKEKSEKLIEDFANLVNGGDDIPALLDKYKREHRTLQQSMFKVVMSIIVMVSQDGYATDGRNEYSKVVAKKLIAGFAEMDKLNEKEVLMKIGYSEKEAEVKAEEYKKRFLENPIIYLPLV